MQNTSEYKFCQKIRAKHQAGFAYSGGAYKRKSMYIVCTVQHMIATNELDNWSIIGWTEVCDDPDHDCNAEDVKPILGLADACNACERRQSCNFVGMVYGVLIERK